LFIFFTLRTKEMDRGGGYLDTEEDKAGEELENLLMAIV
jgi:hypothetical protein